MLSPLEWSAIVVFASVLVDFWLKQHRRKRLHLAITFLFISEWLRKNEWGDIHRAVVSFVHGLFVKVFGARVFSVRFPATVLAVSLATTTLAMLLAMALISPAELAGAGFRDLGTPFPERVVELVIELGRKTHTIGFIFAINALFDAVAITVSYLVLKRLVHSGGDLLFTTLVGMDAIISLFCAAAIIVGIEGRFYTAHMARSVLSGLPTTSLVIQGTPLLLISLSVVLPILAYCTALIGLLICRWVLNLVTAATSRFAEVDDTVFTQAGVLLGGLIAAGPPLFQLWMIAYVWLLALAQTLVVFLLLAPFLLGVMNTISDLPSLLGW